MKEYKIENYYNVRNHETVEDKMNLMASKGWRVVGFYWSPNAALGKPFYEVCYEREAKE